MRKGLVITALLLTTSPAYGEIQDINYSSRTYWGTEAPKVQSNFVELDALKSDKESSVVTWDGWPLGTAFTTSSPPVWYEGKFYRCISPYTKIVDENPEFLTSNFEEYVSSDGTYNPTWEEIAGKPSFNTLATVDLSGAQVNDIMQLTTTGWEAVPITTGTGTVPSGTAVGQTLRWTGSAWTASTFSFDLTALSDLTIGGANLIDDTATNGATTRLWSADKVFDNLATKVTLTDINSQSKFEALVGWTLPEGGTGSLTLTESATDPDVATLSEGDMVVSRASGDMFYKSATGSYVFAGVYTVDPTPPSGTYCSNYTGDPNTLFCEDFGVGSTKVWTNNGWGEMSYDSTTLTSRSLKLVYGAVAANASLDVASRPNLSLNQSIGYEIKYRAACGNATNNFKLTTNYYGLWVVPSTCGVEETRTGTFAANNDNDMIQLETVPSMATGNTYYIDSIRLFTP